MESLLTGFEKEMVNTNKAASTIKASLKYVKDFMFWLSENGINDIKAVKENHFDSYFKYLQNLPNQRKSGGLSDNYILSRYGAIKRFSRYLEYSKGIILKVKVNLPKNQAERKILTQDEIKKLISVCKNDVLGIRDKAMFLGVLYGCGLRRTECQSLNIQSIDFIKQRIFVKGKRNKERYVPFNGYVSNILNDYITNARPKLNRFNDDALFLNFYGSRLSGNGMAERLKVLLKEAGITKQIGLHSLRSSISTHLLQNGLDIKKVQNFLSHKFLDTTSIYLKMIENETV